MTTHIVLDATELTKDFMCRNVTFQLLSHWAERSYGSVWVPESVFHEVVANYLRGVDGVTEALSTVNKRRRRFGLVPVPDPASDFDYSAYLQDRFDEVLGFNVMPFPEVTHASLVARATTRTAPFDERGSGYRDALVWESIKGLANGGGEVFLVSDDKIFSDGEGELASVLRAEVADKNVHLVTNLSDWLISRLPWDSKSPDEALARSRAERVLDYLMASDFQEEIWPEIEDLGFSSRPYKVEIDDVAWGGEFNLTGSRSLGDGLTLAEYEIDESVEFTAEFPLGTPIDMSWETEENLGRLVATGMIEFVVRLAVSHDQDLGFSIESLGWRAKDGKGRGLAPLSDPAIESLF